MRARRTGLLKSVISLFLTMMTLEVSQSFDTQCPDASHYQYDNQKDALYYDLNLKLGGSEGNYYYLTVTLDVEDSFTYESDAKIDFIKQIGEVLYYRIHFPRSGRSHRITKMKLNGILFCHSVPPYPADPYSQTRSITLTSYIHPRRTYGGSYGGWEKPQPKTTQTWPNSFHVKYSGNKFFNIPPIDITLYIPPEEPLGTYPTDFYQPGEKPNTHPLPKTNDKPSYPRSDDSSTSRPKRVVPKAKMTPPKKYRGGPYGDICGRQGQVINLIQDGEAVSKGDYPWVAAIFHKDPGDGADSYDATRFVCGGSLISNRHIITGCTSFSVEESGFSSQFYYAKSAHCVLHLGTYEVLGPENFYVILGKLNLLSESKEKDEQRVLLVDIKTNAEYNRTTSMNDIAVLVLVHTVQFSENVRPVCLWQGSTNLEKIVGKNGTVVGWGIDLIGNLMTSTPKLISLPVVSNEMCLRSEYRFKNFLHENSFCAGSRDGRGPCKGDSGGGFIMYINGRWTLRGIVSLALRDFSTRSCDLTNYIIFADASKYGLDKIIL